MTAAGIDRKAAIDVDGAARDERAALALGAEAEVFDLDQHGDREAVVELGDVDVVRSEPGPLEEPFGDDPGGQRRDVVAHEDGKLDARLRVGDAALGDGPDEYGRPAAITGPFGAGHDHRTGPVRLQAKVKQAQRAGDHPG